jgi:hypothetical protein
MKIQKHSQILAGLLVFSTLMLGSCVKDTLYNTPHPDKGAVVVSTDWSGRSSESIKPIEYILRIGEEEQTVSADVNTFKSLLVPGTQHLLVYHQTDGITISGTTATVNTLEDGSLNSMPGYLFSSYKDILIPADDTLRVVMPMKQHIRQLVLNLKLKDGDEKIIAGTSATLTGIASSVDLTTSEINAAGSKTLKPNFKLSTASTLSSTAAVPVLTATLRLLGIMTAEKQALSIAVTLTNGTTQAITTDLTDYLRNFGGGDMEPLVLDAMLSLPPEVGVTATITDWNIVDNGDINVN